MPTDAHWLEAMPEVYDQCLGPALFAPFAERTAADAAARSPRRVLEIAAGTGILTAELAAALPAAELTATDLNPAMVACGAQRVPAATWQAADAQHLDLPDGVFDLVACQFGAMFFPDKPAAFAETARVLRPGGTVLFSSLGRRRGLASCRPPCRPACTRCWPTRRTSSSGSRTATTTRTGSPPTWPPAAWWRSPSSGWCCGVGRCRPRRSPAGFCYGTPLRFQLDQRGSLPELTERLQREMTARLGTGPVAGDLAAFLVTARPRLPPGPRLTARPADRTGDRPAASEPAGRRPPGRPQDTRPTELGHPATGGGVVPLAPRSAAAPRCRPLPRRCCRPGTGWSASATSP